ncbi:hypothetical protein AAHA92_33956 [Salvia divinorum]|uniref:Major facilitator superfamily (MFS) profile domain-containing protein n=1 Tax=Salvia divinorum TaxID=28513 RepID=A0ABD1FKQ4_SALDI
MVQMGDSDHVYSLDEALATVGFGKYQGLMLAYGGLGYIADAMEIMILSFIGAALESEWHLSPGEKSLISTVVFAGMLVGSYFWGVISDAYGRKKGILGLATITSVDGLLSAFSPNYMSLLVLRCIAGIGLGGQLEQYSRLVLHGLSCLILAGGAYSQFLLDLASSDGSKCTLTMLHSQKSKKASLYLDVFILSLAKVPGLIVAAFIVDRVGRKLCMIIMFGVASILLIPLLTHQNEAITTALLLGTRALVSATFIVACIYVPEAVDVEKVKVDDVN